MKKKILSTIIIIATLGAIYFLCINTNPSTNQEVPVWDSTLINHSKIPDSI
jgi:hypothetical protein